MSGLLHILWLAGHHCRAAPASRGLAGLKHQRRVQDNQANFCPDLSLSHQNKQSPDCLMFADDMVVFLQCGVCLE